MEPNYVSEGKWKTYKAFRNIALAALAICIMAWIDSFDSEQQTNIDITSILGLTTLTLFSIALLYLTIGIYTRCPHCRKWYAMKNTHREITDRMNTVKKERIRGEDHMVPAIHTRYAQHRKCKYCGTKDIVEQSNTKKV